MKKNWESQFIECEYSSKLLNKIRSLNELGPSKLDINAIKKAIYYAKKYHSGQTRQSGEPYYTHPLEVAYMFITFAVQDNYTKLYRTDLVITAILHDVIEDTDFTQEKIALVFGENIANQVEALTRIKSHGKISSAEMVRTLLEQEKYDLLLIKMFDRLHNVYTLWAKSPEKIQKIVAETIQDFLILPMYFENLDIEKILLEKCLELTGQKLPKNNNESVLASLHIPPPEPAKAKPK